jgi:hypothetical protein
MSLLRARGKGQMMLMQGMMRYVAWAAIGVLISALAVISVF